MSWLTTAVSRARLLSAGGSRGLRHPRSAHRPRGCDYDDAEPPSYNYDRSPTTARSVGATSPPARAFWGPNTLDEYPAGPRSSQAARVSASTSLVYLRVDLVHLRPVRRG